MISRGQKWAARGIIAVALLVNVADAVLPSWATFIFDELLMMGLLLAMRWVLGGRR